MTALPDIYSLCSRHFSYAQIIQCGETWERLNVEGVALSNLPLQPATYSAIQAICLNILDPVVDTHGEIQLSYGFASQELTRNISRRIAPKLDQHAGHELNRQGRFICERLGMAVDFSVPGLDSLSLARWIVSNTPFDRLYYYGPQRPIHVSHGPESRAVIFEMLSRKDGKGLFPVRRKRL